MAAEEENASFSTGAAPLYSAKSRSLIWEKQTSAYPSNSTAIAEHSGVCPQQRQRLFWFVFQHRLSKS